MLYPRVMIVSHLDPCSFDDYGVLIALATFCCAPLSCYLTSLRKPSFNLFHGFSPLFLWPSNLVVIFGAISFVGHLDGVHDSGPVIGLIVCKCTFFQVSRQ
ncbi:hypothetical protein Hanom_Chr10g00952041 [Helianthus anomalus]